MLFSPRDRRTLLWLIAAYVCMTGCHVLWNLPPYPA